MIIVDNNRFKVTNPNLRKIIANYNVSQNKISFLATNLELMKLIEDLIPLTHEQFQNCLKYITKDIENNLKAFDELKNSFNRELMPNHRSIKTIKSYSNFIFNHSQFKDLNKSTYVKLINDLLELTIKYISNDKKAAISDIIELDTIFEVLHGSINDLGNDLTINHYESLKIVINTKTQQFKDQQDLDQSLVTDKIDTKSDANEIYIKFFDNTDIFKNEDFENKLVQDISSVGIFLLNHTNLKLNKLVELYTILLKHKFSDDLVSNLLFNHIKSQLPDELSEISYETSSFDELAKISREDILKLQKLFILFNYDQYYDKLLSIYDKKANLTKPLNISHDSQEIDVSDQQDFNDELLRNLLSTSDYPSKSETKLAGAIISHNMPRNKSIVIAVEKALQAEQAHQLEIQKAAQEKAKKESAIKKAKQEALELYHQQKKTLREQEDAKDREKVLKREQNLQKAKLEEEVAKQKKVQKELNIQKSRQEKEIADQRKIENKLKQEIEDQKAKQNFKSSSDQSNVQAQDSSLSLKTSTTDNPAKLTNVVPSAKYICKTQKLESRSSSLLKTNTKEFKEMAFLKAISKENLVTCKLYLDSEVKINARFDGDTDLHVAVRFNNLKLVQSLVNERININAKGQQDLTALHLAIINSVGIEIVKCLVENGAEINTIHKNFSYMHYAARYSNIGVAELLFSKNNLLINQASEELETTPLHLAAEFNHVKMIKFLLSHGADINAIVKSSNSPLYLAVIKGNNEAVRYLLDGKADVNILGQNNHNILQLAIVNKHIDTLKLLLNNGIDPNKTVSNEITALAFATNLNDLESMKCLLEHNASVNQKTIFDRTALHSAAIKGNVEAAKLLLEYKSDINAVDDEGKTFMHYLWLQENLTLEEKYEITRKFKDFYDKSIMDDEGNNFIFYAVDFYPQIYENLINEFFVAGEEIASQSDLLLHDLSSSPDLSFEVKLVGDDVGATHYKNGAVAKVEVNN